MSETVIENKNLWRWMTIQDIASHEPYALVGNTFGARLKASEYTLWGVPILRGNNLSGPGKFNVEGTIFVTEAKADELRSQNAIAGDVIFTQQGSVGQIGIIPKDSGYPRWVVSQSQMKLRPDPNKALPHYVYYYFRQPEIVQLLQSRAIVTGVPHINLGILRTFPIFIPPIEEQYKIVDVLGSLDDKIELNRRMNATLEATARALFQSWFVDFDPVHAKAHGEQPSGMDVTTAALFPDHFEDSPLGPIPAGWQVKTIPEAIELNPQRRLPQGQIAPYLAMENMPTHSARAINWIYRDVGSGTKFKNGDVLVARITPCLENGKTAYVDFLDENQIGWGSTEYIVFRSKDDLPLEFPYFLARTDEFRNFAIRNMSGTSGRQRVNASAFDNYFLVVPTKEIGLHFGAFTKHIVEKMKANDNVSHTLAETRDTLLPKLISGEVRVENMANLIEETS